MKILIIMDPGILVPPKGYGGHERLVALFAGEYCRLGHEVHLLVTSGSYIDGCTMHAFGKEGFPPKKSDALKAIPSAWLFLLKHRNKFDFIHNFGRLVYLLPVLNNTVRKIMTYGREISNRNIQYINKLPNRNITFTGCSDNLVSRGSVAGKWRTIYNAIDFNKYELKDTVREDAPLIFLGRIERVKGCHTAIAVAKATNNQLIIAGNISPLKDEQEYFRQEIAPHIDSKQIVYIGQVNDAQKNEYLGQSKALLFTIEWDEPFGIVMIESMACGTPVIAFNRGSVSEVVDEGISGYKVNSIEDMKKAVQRVDIINRRKCREQAEKRFDVKVIAGEYLNLFDN
jgi:glycosyltransferase involved in cell wall biosynthesis